MGLKMIKAHNTIDKMTAEEIINISMDDLRAIENARREEIGRGFR